MVARKVLAVCQAPFDLQGREARVGLSAGMALFPQHGSSFDELARHADTAMYAAKRSGRLQVRCYAGTARARTAGPGHATEPDVGLML